MNLAGWGYHAQYLMDELELGERVAMSLDSEACGFDAIFDLQAEAFFAQELPVDGRVDAFWDADELDREEMWSSWDDDDEPATWDTDDRQEWYD